ncbi:MAG: hypothetical protein JWN86_32 [Planctomycetota bacterium]|nr:hypothetical protein [Planctomycetota bacterium]
MAAMTEIDRPWIQSEFAKLIAAERSLITEAKSRASSPPDPTLGVLYHEIEIADERHLKVLETIAARYGYTPSRSESGGVGETLGRLRDKVSEIGSTPSDLLNRDLQAKSDALHWETAWTQAFVAIGDATSADELSAVLKEDQVHHDALLEGLKHMIEQGARGSVKT